MKKVLCFLAFLLVVAAFHSCEKEQDFDESLLIGKWIETGTSPYRYKYNANHTGERWKEAENVLEGEGEKFTWQLVKAELDRMYIRRIDGVSQPENFIVTELTATSLKYKDESKSYSFTKIN